MKFKDNAAMKEMSSVNNLSVSDEIIASIELDGRNLASINRSNFAKIDDIIQAVLSLAGNYIGLAKLSIRNKTQGWAMMMGIAARRSMISHSVKTQFQPSIRSNNGTQLAIQWN